jgi:cell division septal protein FtsQ
MVGGRSERGPRRRAAAASRSVVVPFPRGAADARLDLARFVPSGRSLLATLGVLAAIGFAYWLAYSTPVFAVHEVVVRGASPSLERQVKKATSDLVGSSLVSIDATEVEGTLRALPEVAGASVDRSFPNTLVVKIAPERPVAVIRLGTSAWLATGAGKVVREIAVGTQRGMPRLWLRRGATIRLGGQIPAGLIPATHALASARVSGLGGRVKGIRTDGEELTLVLHHGTELRLGRDADVVMKLVIARRVLELVGNDAEYIDVSVPQRPVSR